MMSRVPWSELIGFLAVFLFLYYIVVIIAFYRREVLILFKGGHDHDAPELSPSMTLPAQPAAESLLYNQVMELMQECREVFKAGAEQSLEKSQVLEALRLRLRKYPQVVGTAFQVALSNHIDQELQTRCGLSLDDDDIKKLWQ